MKSIRLFACMSVVVLAFTVCAWAGAAESGCKEVRGSIVWTVIQTHNEPLGRVVGSVTEDLNGSSSAIILEPPTPVAGGLTTHDLDVFVTGPQDVLIGDSRATFTFVAPGTVEDSQIITITGGTGKFAGATGTLQIQGMGYNLTPTGGIPGVTFFDVRYKGQVCNAKWD